MNPLQLDEVHSVSDLHLGGEPGRQIFAGTAELAELIHLLRARPPQRQVAFVVNGDFIDFLAEPGAIAFDPDGAEGKLARIQADPAFQPIFDALRAFVATPGRLLVIVIGNHDLELALPAMRRVLLDSLCAGDVAARGRVLLSMDGTGFSATIGGASVLCIHGNDVDGWNATDYERLRLIGRDREMGLPVQAWTPNAGSKMVIEVMNGIKRKLPFVDLLKPETEAVVPIMLALDQGSAASLRDALGVASRLALDWVKRKTGFLSLDEEAGENSDRRGARDGSGDTDPLDRVLQRAFAGTAARRSTPKAAAELVRMTEQRLRDKVDPVALVASDAERELGLWSAAGDWLRGSSKVEVLREALEPVQKDQSFDPGAEDSTFTDLDKLVAPQLAFVIAGHTHLERSLRRKNGAGRYFNTGTWARLIRIPPDKLTDEAAFKEVFDALRAPTIAELDQTPNLVMRQPAVASVWTEGGTTHGELRRVILKGGAVSFARIGEGV